MTWLNQIIPDDDDKLPEHFISGEPLDDGRDDIIEALLNTHTFQEWIGYVPNSQINGSGKFHINEDNSLNDFLEETK